MSKIEYSYQIENEQEAFKKERFVENKQTNDESPVGEKSTIVNSASKDEDTNLVTKEDVVKKTEVVTEVKKPAKSETKVI